jgi:hypothetical protein
VHTGPGKQPIEFDKLLDYVQSPLEQPQAAVGLRNKVMVLTAYFGVRRGAEVVAFVLDDVLETSSAGIHLRVRCQKNDSAGIGQTCVLPAIDAMGSSSPPLLFLHWLAVRRDLAPSSDFLFVTTTGSRRGHQVSVDSFRKHVTAVFGDGTAAHSLRKGGAQFYSRRGVDSDVTRQQGGWRTSTVMEQTYTTMSAAEVRASILAVGKKSSVALEIGLRCRRIGAKPEDAVTTDVQAARSLLTIVRNNLAEMTTRLLAESKVHKYVKHLSRHTDTVVRDEAAQLYTTIQANWMASQAAKRRKVSEH